MKLPAVLVLMALVDLGLATNTDSSYTATELFPLTGSILSPTLLPQATFTTTPLAPRDPESLLPHSSPCPTPPYRIGGQTITCPGALASPPPTGKAPTRPATALARATPIKKGGADVTICTQTNGMICTIGEPAAITKLQQEGAAPGGARPFGFNLGSRGPGAGDRRAFGRVARQLR